MKMLYDDINYVNVGNEINTCTTQEYFSYLSSKLYKIWYTYSEGTMSQIFYLGPRFYFMKIIRNDRLCL